MKRNDPLRQLPGGVTTAGDAVRRAFEGFNWFPNELIPVMFSPSSEEAMHTALDGLMHRYEASQLGDQEIQVSVTFFETVTQEPKNEAARRHFVSWVHDNILRGTGDERQRVAQLYTPLKQLADSLQNRALQLR